MATDHYDVVIIGSGAGGGTLAWKLAPDRQADPAPRARRLPPPRARQLGHRRGVPARQVHDDRDLGRRRRRRVHARAELLRRRQHQVLRRRAVPAAAGGLRRHHTTTVASRRRGRWATTTSSRGTPPPRTCTWCTAPRARTRPTALAAATTPTRRFSHEPRIQQLSDDLEKLGLHPSHLPIGVMLDQDDDGNAVHTSTLHPVRPRRRLPVPGGRQGRRADRRGRPRAGAPQPRARDATPRSSGSRPMRSGRTVTAVVATLADGSEARFSGDVVVVSCGALNSALLLLKSANDTHDDAHADGSDGAGVAADRVAHGGEDDRGRDAHERSKSRSEELVGVDSRDQVASGNPIGNSKMLARMPNLAATI